MGSNVARACLFPVSNIGDDAKRQEFLRDYCRLGRRCGYNAMDTTFFYYMVEQAVEAGECPEPASDGRSKIQNFGHRNTSEILARFVEKRWMDFYLTDEEISSTHLGQILMGTTIHSLTDDGGRLQKPLTGTIHRSDLRKVNELLHNHIDLAGGSRLISPDQIRTVFAEIDARYEK